MSVAYGEEDRHGLIEQIRIQLIIHQSVAGLRTLKSMVTIELVELLVILKPVLML